MTWNALNAPAAGYEWHKHRHTPCEPCVCRLQPFPDGHSQCSGAPCPECPPAHPTFGPPMTEIERDLRIWRATHDKLTLVPTAAQEARDER